MISLVIPLYNEQRNVPNLLEAINRLKQELSEELEVLLVNDASTDQTLAQLQQLAPEHKIISYAQNRGKGFALRTGVASSTGRIVFFTDADLAYGLFPIHQAMQVFEEQQPDAVIGSRRLDQDGYRSYPWHRRLMSGCFSLISRLVLRTPYSDSQCGMKGFEGEVGRALFARCKTDRFGIDFELLYLLCRAGKQVQEIPVRITRHTESSVHPIRDSLRMLLELFQVVNRHRKD